MLGCKAVKFGMVVEILRSALGQRALGFFGRLQRLRPATNSTSASVKAKRISLMWLVIEFEFLGTDS
jgi:hypothetical protein